MTFDLWVLTFSYVRVSATLVCTTLTNETFWTAVGRVGYTHITNKCWENIEMAHNSKVKSACMTMSTTRRISQIIYTQDGTCGILIHMKYDSRHITTKKSILYKDNKPLFFCFVILKIRTQTLLELLQWFPNHYQNTTCT